MLEGVAKKVERGQSEFAIGGQLMAGLADRGCTSHVVLVATDDRIFRYRHPIPTAKQLDRYAMMVVCARRHGLVANVTRFIHFGPLSAEVDANRAKCAYIDVRMNAATRPGNTVADVFQTAVDAYREVGFPDDWRLLHQGGPTGYAAREYLATPACDEVIRTNEMYAWNPAIRGFKSEDTILVGGESNQFLTHTGDWPYIPITYEGKEYHRPDILIR